MSSELAVAAGDAVSDALMEQSRWARPGALLGRAEPRRDPDANYKTIIFLITCFEIRAKLKIRSTGAVAKLYIYDVDI